MLVRPTGFTPGISHPGTLIPRRITALHAQNGDKIHPTIRQNYQPKPIALDQRTVSTDREFLNRSIQQNGMSKIKSNPDIEARELAVKYKAPYGKPTDQKYSGRCWIFSSLNMLRSAVLGKYGEDFSYSQNYIAYWDKIERANWYLETMIGLADNPPDERTLETFRSETLTDGGEWQFFANIVKKYGLVPDYAMKETNFSGNTTGYNELLTNTLKEQGAILQKLARQGASDEVLQGHKNVVLEKIRGILDAYLGTPPTRFRVKVEAKKDWLDSFKESVTPYIGDLNGALKTQTPEKPKFVEMTPLEFLQENPIKLDDLVEVSFIPGLDKNAWLHLPYANNMVGGSSMKNLNIPLDEGLAAIRRSIMAGKPALCVSDVKNLDTQKKLFSEVNDETDRLFSLDALPHLSKGERLENGVSNLAHAMLFVGCDDASPQPIPSSQGVTVEQERNGPMWLVENSWERANAVYMTDSWVKEHVYETVIDKKFLSPEIQAKLEDENTPVIELPIWHYMSKI